MKINLAMPRSLRPYFFEELHSYRQKMGDGNFEGAWRHLERAHVIGQAYPWEHSYAHWKMLQFGFRIKNGREVIGQIPRLLVGGVKSFVGQIPVGNTGGANVPPLRSLPIEEDILEIFRKANVTGK